MAKLKVSKIGIEVEAELEEVGEVLIKRIPRTIENWWKNRKNKKLIERTINDIRRLAFKPWIKYWQKFRVYENFALPKSMKQVKDQVVRDLEHVNESWYFKEFENRIDKEFAHLDVIKDFQEQNGGQDNFGVYLERAIKLNGFAMIPFRKVYTYSKKEKAVCVLEEFRQSDNSYNIFVYCTKNWGHKHDTNLHQIQVWRERSNP
jgi:hypothetical protein